MSPKNIDDQELPLDCVCERERERERGGNWEKYESTKKG